MYTQLAYAEQAFAYYRATLLEEFRHRNAGLRHWCRFLRRQMRVSRLEVIELRDLIDNARYDLIARRGW